MRKIILILFLSNTLSACNSTEDKYIDGCREQGASKKMCSCVYDKLEAHYGEEKLALFLESPIDTISEAPQYFDNVITYTQQCYAKGIR